MRPWESLHAEGPTALAGLHPLNVVYAASLAIYKILSSSASDVVLCTVHVSKVSLGHLT